MSQPNYSNIVIRFEPPLPCVECKTPATYALIGECEFSAQCPTHGYCYGVSTAEEYASVARFVVNEMDGQGVATVLATCDPSDVPGYTVEDVNGVVSTEIDSAWTVRYVDTEGKESTMFVVWEIAYLSFYLYTFEDSQS